MEYPTEMEFEQRSRSSPLHTASPEFDCLRLLDIQENIKVQTQPKYGYQYTITITRKDIDHNPNDPMYTQALAFYSATEKKKRSYSNWRVTMGFLLVQWLINPNHNPQLNTPTKYSTKGKKIDSKGFICPEKSGACKRQILNFHQLTKITVTNRLQNLNPNEVSEAPIATHNQSEKHALNQ
ncbi:hypothetical protein NPIL_174891 [Nephila pilipes]|uniref:Uncharacterized protein n=1 Tax=Nephila pilipes TaxID=299642 RepID=A0A8X6TTA1_NEPPI|nr:hypothetical protein NPIL_174891 [Nephila pilipes]